MMTARGAVLADLTATQVADAAAVSLLEDSVTQRRWWLEQWPEGAQFITGLVAQDVQDALLDSRGRWPLCRWCESAREQADLHSLHVDPDLGGPDPHWICETSGTRVARVGELSQT